jgi:hypothetical protein
MAFAFAALAPLSPLAGITAPQPAPRALMTLYDAPGITRACDEGIARAQQLIKQMDAKKGAGTIFDEWNRLAIVIEDTVNTVYLLGNVSPDGGATRPSPGFPRSTRRCRPTSSRDEKLFARRECGAADEPAPAKLKDLVEGSMTRAWPRCRTSAAAPEISRRSSRARPRPQHPHDPTKATFAGGAGRHAESYPRRRACRQRQISCSA